MNPILGINTFGCNTTDKNHLMTKTIWSKTVGLIPWTIHEDSHMHALLCIGESETGVHTFWTYHLCTCTHSLVCVPAGPQLLLVSHAGISFSMILRDLPLEWVAIKYNACAIVSNQNHNANNLPLWTWWKPQDPQRHSPPLTSRAKGYAPPENMLKSLLCWSCSPWL